MTNRNLIREFIEGNRRYGAVNHIGFTDNTLWNYSTVMCEIDRENHIAAVNVRKYGTATSKVQSEIKYMLSLKGYKVKEFTGESAHFWNAGYMGAQRWRASEFRPTSDEPIAYKYLNRESA